MLDIDYSDSPASGCRRTSYFARRPAAARAVRPCMECQGSYHTRRETPRQYALWGIVPGCNSEDPVGQHLFWKTVMLSLAPPALSHSAGVIPLYRMTDGSNNVLWGDLNTSPICFDLSGFRWILLDRQRHHYLREGIFC